MVKNKPELVEKAETLTSDYKDGMTYDQSKASAAVIAGRMKRTFALTVDFDTIEGDGSITIRDRDSTDQQRMSVEEAMQFLEEKINP